MPNSSNFHSVIKVGVLFRRRYETSSPARLSLCQITEISNANYIWHLKKEGNCSRQSIFFESRIAHTHIRNTLVNKERKRKAEMARN